MFKNTVCALLAVTLSSLTLGCTSSRNLSDNEGLNQDPDGKVEIRTRDGAQYFLSDWSCNASGDYIGVGKRLKGPYVSHFSGTIAIENITSVRNRNASSKARAKQFKKGKTASKILKTSGFILFEILKAYGKAFENWELKLKPSTKRPC